MRCSYALRLGAGPSSATLVNLDIVRRVALSQANIWSRAGVPTRARSYADVIQFPLAESARSV